MVNKATKAYNADMLFTLNLAHALEYRADDVDLTSIDDMPIGAETCFAYTFSYDDVIFRMERGWSGSREPFTAQEKAIVEAGEVLPHRPGHDLVIPTGRYRLLQTIPVTDEASLRRTAMPFAGTEASGRLYVRLLKENAFECVMQLFLAI